MVERFTLFCYRLLWLPVGLVMPLILFWRSYKGKEDSTRLGERYGIASLSRPSSVTSLYWLHGASVGESVSSLVLAMALLKSEPKSHILITSGTVTSQHMLNRRIDDLGLSDRISCQYHPHDKSGWVERFLDHWRPDALVMMESEIWPNMTTISHGRGIPVMMASAQISYKSMRRWSGFARFLARPVFATLSMVITTDKEQADRFESLIPQDRITIGGSMKAAAPQLPTSQTMVDKITEGAAGRLIVLLASSHDGEEDVFVDAMEAINQSGSFLGIIAPRHLNRTPAIVSILDENGLTTSLRSRGQFPEPSTKIWIADAMGEMGSLIEAADIIVLGGGFAKLGGHNPMEMAAFGKGVISGPHIFKNKPIFSLLETHQGVLFVDNASKLGDTITMLSASQTMRDSLNSGAAAAYNTLTDAAEHTARLIQSKRQSR